MAGKKKQVVALIDPELLTALDTLRIITRESRARVLEDVIRPAVNSALGRRNKAVTRVEILAEKAGVELEQYVKAYAKALSSGAYGPGLEALEADDSRVRAYLVRAEDAA